MKQMTIRALICLTLSLLITISFAVGTASEQVLLNSPQQSKQFVIVSTPLPAIEASPQEPCPIIIKDATLQAKADTLQVNEKPLSTLHMQDPNPALITHDQFICNKLAKLEASREILNNPQVSKLFENWWCLYQDSLSLADQEEFSKKSEEVEKQIRIIITAGIITAWQNNL